MKVTASFLDTLEEQIRSGTAPALESFLHASSYEVPRKLTARYANLLRRMGSAKYALSTLNPIIRDDLEKPSADEIIEYASCLIRLELIDEGIALLDKVAHLPRPEIQYELGAAYITKWEFQTAIPYLIKYSTFPDLTLYKVCVGEINLATAYLYSEQVEKAQSLLKELVKKAQENNFILLWGNALELLGEIAFIQGDLDLAKKLFLESSEKLKSSNPRYQLYLDKWMVFIKMVKEKGSKQSLKECLQLRKKAASLGDWNSLCEIEIHKAIVTNDLKLITDLYFGIPYREYRKRILSVWKKPIALADFYDRKMGPGIAPSKKIFDVATGTDLFSGAKLKPGQLSLRLLQTLCTDFYTPFSTTKLFSLIFKDEFYNPRTSHHRVYRAIKILNLWFVENKIPLIVMSGEFGYRLRAKEAYILRIPINSGHRSKIDDFINLLKEHGLTDNFSSQMVAQKLGISHRTATRTLGEAVNSGKMLRRGRSQTTIYSIA